MKDRIFRISDRLALYGVAFAAFFLPIYNSLTSVGIGFAVFFLFVSALTGARSRQWPALALPLAVFFLFSLISFFNTPDIKESLVGLRKLAMYVLFYLAIIHAVNTRKRLNFLTAVLLFSAAAVGLDGVYQGVAGFDWFSTRPFQPFPHQGITRLTASFHQAGSLGIYLAGVTPLAGSLALFGFKGHRKIVLSAVLLLLLLVLFLSFSPGAALGCFTAFMLLSILKKRWIIVSVLILILMSGFLFLPASLVGWPGGHLYMAAGGRILMAEVSLRIIDSHPWIGSGLHTYPAQYSKFCPPGFPFYKDVSPYAHNSYLQMAAEIGLLGLGSFLWLIIQAYRMMGAAYKKAEDGLLKALLLGFLGGMSSFLAHGLYESNLYTSQGALLFWLILGLIATLCRILNKEEPARAK